MKNRFPEEMTRGAQERGKKKGSGARAEKGRRGMRRQMRSLHGVVALNLVAPVKGRINKCTERTIRLSLDMDLMCITHLHIVRFKSQRLEPHFEWTNVFPQSGSMPIVFTKAAEVYNVERYHSGNRSIDPVPACPCCKGKL